MNDQLTGMQMQIDRLSDELRTAQGNIRKLEKRSAWRPSTIALIGLAFVAALAIGSSGTKAASQTNLTGLSADVPTKVKGPFEVVDDQGKTIFRVQDRDSAAGSAALARGAYIYDLSNKPVVDLSAAGLGGGGGGGRVRVTSVTDENTFIVMAAVQDTTAIKVSISGKDNVLIGRNQGKDSVIQLNNAIGKPAATLSANGNDGSINVFGSSEKPTATLKSDAGEGKLWINDTSGKTVAGVFANDNGGVVKVMKNGDPTTYTSMSAINAGIGLAVRVSGVRKSFVGTSGDDGNGAVFVYGNTDQPAAALRTYGGGKGLVSIYSGGNAIAFMTERDKHAGGGNFTASDPAGNGIFSAGFTGEGGDACINRKNGLKCLGIGLPLQID